MADYQLTALGATILRSLDGAYIPADPGNSDYVAYEAWVAAGNMPDPAPTPPRPKQINPGDFLLRFTPAEQSAIQQLAITNGQIALGLTMGLARGYIDLAGPLLGPWMDALTAAGAIAPGRKSVILTP
jgi:hypothetical protein